MGWHGRRQDICHQLASVPDLLESSQKVAGCPSGRSLLLEQETLRPQKNHSLKEAETAHRPGPQIPSQLSLLSSPGLPGGPVGGASPSSAEGVGSVPVGELGSYISCSLKTKA